jgi:glycosyltransferase involved in cell wall biosynthesis
MTSVSSGRKAIDSMTELNSSEQGARKEKKTRALLLDLSGDENAAFEWAATQLPDAEIRLLNKIELKWASKWKALGRVRSLGPDIFCVFANDLRMQSGQRTLMLFAGLAGSSHVLLGDAKNRIKSRSRLGVILIEAPRCAFEFLLGYGFVVPLYWVLIELVTAALTILGVVRASMVRRSIGLSESGSLSALFVRATLTSASEGGMPTHVSGFATGSKALGHRLKFLVSGEKGDKEDTFAFAPSTLLSVTKALLEVWNNLVFTAKALHETELLSGVDFIYQRHNRFNYTGVLLSMVSGLPLLLEFNGSEVWLARNWDPIGLTWLIERIESLNLRAADLIFVVSEVQRRELIASGISATKIIVNLNGVDTERFRPNCGGSEIRNTLVSSNQIIVGFTGTFGPWHGAPVLAAAAKLLNNRLPGCHFLFIGNGEQRAVTESIIESGSVSATFTGSIDHTRVPAYLDACDILASPHVPSSDGSEFFGSPTKLFEYLAMEKGIVASRLGQVGDVIIDEQNGLLVEPGNASELAKAIERLAADDEFRRRLGTAARSDAIARYTWRHNATRVFEAARELLRHD